MKRSYKKKKKANYLILWKLSQGIFRLLWPRPLHLQLLRVHRDDGRHLRDLRLDAGRHGQGG